MLYTCALYRYPWFTNWQWCELESLNKHSSVTKGELSMTHTICGLRDQGPAPVKCWELSLDVIPCWIHCKPPTQRANGLLCHKGTCTLWPEHMQSEIISDRNRHSDHVNGLDYNTLKHICTFIYVQFHIVCLSIVFSKINYIFILKLGL